MKFIGQYIQDFIARFRSDVYLEDVSSGTIASGGNLGLDSNNKIVKANEPTSHDAVTLAGTPDYITLSGQEITRNAIDLTADVTGTLPVNKGGTGAASLTDKAILLGNGTSAVESSVHLNYANLTQIGADEDRLVIGDSNSTKVAVYGQGGVPLEILVPFPPGNVSNTAGGDLNLKAGTSSGNAIGGSVKFFSSAAGSSGASINGSNEIASFDNVGNLQIDGGLTTGSTSFVNSSGVVQVATQGTIDHDSLANFVTAEHVDWAGASAGTIHSSNIPTLNQNTTGNAATATNLTASTSTAVGLGTIELGHASDTTIARSAAGKVTIESAPIQTTQMSMTHHNFFMNASSTTNDFFFPYNNLNEGSSTSQYYQRTIAPYAGKILKVIIRPSAAIGTACKLQFHKITNTDLNFGTEIEEVTNVNLNTAETSVSTAFSSATFAAGDVVNVSLIKSEVDTANIQAVIVWEYTI
jgi:hypothetical protein